MKRAFLIATALLAGCATTPRGPGVLVLPGSTKTFDQFRADDGQCRPYASEQIRNNDSQEGATTQQRYDFAYQQCMYARGHLVPVARGSMPRKPSPSASTPPPPPPPGSPPPPPAGYRVN
jgi:hypothetical protein